MISCSLFTGRAPTLEIGGQCFTSTVTRVGFFQFENAVLVRRSEARYPLDLCFEVEDELQVLHDGLVGRPRAILNRRLARFRMAFAAVKRTER